MTYAVTEENLQLFRNLIQRYICCFLFSAESRERDEKIRLARERVRSASKTFLTTTMAANPSSIIVHQVGITTINIPEAIPEV